MVAKCQSAHFASQQTGRLFDHFVGGGEQRRRHGEAERLCGLEVDRELVLGRCLHWQVGRLLAFQDAVDVTNSCTAANSNLFDHLVGAGEK